jgi:hypothetical protein
MKTAIVVLAVCAIAGPCLAQEPVGCDNFKWPLDKERATLTGTDLPKVTNGDRVTWPIPWATSVVLVSFDNAKLPTPPERAPKSADTFAGFIQVAAPTRPATYKITVSDAAWIDVVQNGQSVKSSDFSGVTGCEGARKSVKFPLAAAPFTIELSSVAANAIKIAISGD